MNFKSLYYLKHPPIHTHACMHAHTHTAIIRKERMEQLHSKVKKLNNAKEETVSGNEGFYDTHHPPPTINGYTCKYV